MGKRKKPFYAFKPNIVIRTLKVRRTSEAVEKAPFFIMKNATSAWTRAGRPMEQKSLEKFCTDYLEKFTEFEENFGFIIAVEPANDRHKEIYKRCTYKRTGASRRRMRDSKKFFVFRDNEKAVVKIVDGSTRIGELKKEGRRLVSSLEYKGDRLTCHLEYLFPEGNKIFEINRETPKEDVKLGTYIIFGVTSIMQ